MALSTTTLAYTETATTNTSVATPTSVTAPLLAAFVLSVYAAQKGNKQLRKLRRKAAFTLIKLKLKESFQSLLPRKRDVGGISSTTLLYILLGLLVLILLFTLPTLVAILVLLIGILLILLTRR
jgi:hypothetical protein